MRLPIKIIHFLVGGFTILAFSGAPCFANDGASTPSSLPVDNMQFESQPVAPYVLVISSTDNTTTGKQTFMVYKGEPSQSVRIIAPRHYVVTAIGGDGKAGSPGFSAH